MARIDLPDGRWVDLRPMSTRAYLAILDHDEGDGTTFVARIRDLRDAVAKGCAGTSWGGPVDDLTPLQLASLVGPWIAATEDDAVPPASGTASVTTSSERGSPATDEG